MFEQLQQAIASLMNRVRVNQIREDLLDGAPVFVKRRRAGGSVVIWFGNRFLALARSGVCMFVRADDWVDWEVHCARLLYPDRPAVRRGVGRCVIIPKVSGISLRQLLRQNRADVRAFAAAAREIRRVHQLPCSFYQDAWSHGDLHLDNIIYDAVADRAVVIDFDTRHDFRLGRIQRQSDDLKVMLLEILGQPDGQWHEAAAAIIEGYGEAPVLDELARQLVIPSGFARILWDTRTYGCPTPLIAQRLESVRAIIQREVAAHHTQPRPTGEGGEPDCLPDR